MKRSTRKALRQTVETAKFYEQLAKQLAEDAHGTYLLANALHLQVSLTRRQLEEQLARQPREWQFWKRRRTDA